MSVRILVCLMSLGAIGCGLDKEELRQRQSKAVKYNDRGLVSYQNGEYDKAIIDLNEAIRLDPQAATAYFNRGLVWHEKGEFDREIDDYNEAIRLNPTTPRRPLCSA